MTWRHRVLIVLVVTIRAVIYGIGGWMVTTDAPDWLPWFGSPAHGAAFCVAVSLLSSWRSWCDCIRGWK